VPTDRAGPPPEESNPSCPPAGGRPAPLLHCASSSPRSGRTPRTRLVLPWRRAMLRLSGTSDLSRDSSADATNPLLKPADGRMSPRGDDGVAVSPHGGGRITPAVCPHTIATQRRCFHPSARHDSCFAGGCG
jgi:hypothetical protein